MSKIPGDVISIMNRLKTAFSESFSFITDVKQLPKRKGIQMNFTLATLDGNPDKIFQLLEFFIDQPYIDIYKKNGTLFVDNKINWDFYFRSKNGCINVHDWKSYSAKVAPFGGRSGVQKDAEGCRRMQKDAEALKDIIEKGLKIYPDYIKAASKENLESAPLDNFLYAMGSLFLLYNHSKN